jgi:transposase-like protein
VSIVWPCSLSVDEYVAAGHDIEVPRPDCPMCSTSMTFWSGYRRFVRWPGGEQRIFVPRARCRRCEVTHALLPSFVLVKRLDVTETIVGVVEELVGGQLGCRRAAKRIGRSHTTVRGWARRFLAQAQRYTVMFAALAVELGGSVPTMASDVGRSAFLAMRAAFRSALSLPGWLSIGFSGFVSAVTGGRLISTNTNSLYLIVGKRRFMPPVP